MNQLREEVVAAAASVKRGTERSNSRGGKSLNGTPAAPANGRSMSNEKISLTNLSISASEQKVRRINDSGTKEEEDVLAQESHLNTKHAQLVPSMSAQITSGNEEPSVKSGTTEDKPPRPEIVAMTPSKSMKVLDESNATSDLKAISLGTDAALAKLMDHGKFTDTLEQLNKAVSQKEKLEAKLNRIKEKIR